MKKSKLRKGLYIFIWRGGHHTPTLVRLKRSDTAEAPAQEKINSRTSQESEKGGEEGKSKDWQSLFHLEFVTCKI